MFAAGIIFLEVITLHGARGLYDALYPAILKKDIPKSLIKCLASCLDENPSRRTSFSDIFETLKSDTSNFDKNDALNGAPMWRIDDEFDGLMISDAPANDEDDDDDDD
jgi:hypothetical protein